MCPQADAQNEGGEEPVVVYGAGRALKRDHRGKLSVPELKNGRGQVVRRPVARYRRSVVIDTGASGSVDEPIILHDDHRGKQTEIIDLEAVDAPAPGLPALLQRVEVDRITAPSAAVVEEPSSKRVCKGAESESVTSPVRAGRQHGFVRASGRPWARERSRQGSSSSASSASSSAGVIQRAAAPADAVEGQGSQQQLLQDDERLARELQQELSSAASDADLARALQEEENRRVYRAPPPAAVDPSRFQLYMRQLDRARLLQATQLQQQHASSSRQQQQPQQPGEAPRSRGRLLESNSRRFRVLQERLSAFGALLNRHIPLAMQLSYVDRDFNENDYETLLALDESVQQRGASQTKINELPVSEHEETKAGKSEACSICLEIPESGDRIRRLPCLHSFHQNCIDTWLQRRGNCPVCKAAI